MREQQIETTFPPNVQVSMVHEIVSLSWLAYALGRCAVVNAASNRLSAQCIIYHPDSSRRTQRIYSKLKLAPAVGFEPTTNRLTADRSTTELRWIFLLAVAECEFASPIPGGKCFLKGKTAVENARRKIVRFGDLVAGAGFEPAAFRL